MTPRPTPSPVTTKARRRPFADPPGHARQYAVRMPDGVRLATDVYLPAHGRGPVLLSRLPYDKAGAECYMPLVADWFTDRGYVVVLQDVRGKVRSGGTLVPFDAEIADGYHTLEWITQQSWSAGPIGMIGDSYYGFTQWAAAAGAHPALAAIAPRVTSADLSALFSRQGVFPLELSACWAVETWVDETLYEYDGQLDWSVRPQAAIAPTLLGGRHPVGLDAWATGLIPATATVPVTGTIPTLHLGGFDDFLLRGQLGSWRRSLLGPAADFLLLDARDHGWTLRRPAGQQYRDPQNSPREMALFLDDYLQPLLPFFDHYLRGRGDHDVAPVRWRIGGGSWEQGDIWPPPRSQPAPRFLTTGFALADRPESARRAVSWQHDARNPVPSHIHPYYPLIDPVDERDTLTRADVLAFVGEPEPSATDLIGPAHLDVSAQSGADSVDLMATLYDLAPDGSAARIADGAIRLRCPWPAPARIDLGDLGYRVEPGHRLALAIAGSSFPRYALHPGNSQDPWTADEFTVAEHTIWVGGAGGARLTFHSCHPESAR
jgi:predicted acyl esterase